MTDETKKKLDQARSVLRSIAEDQAVPKNIRRAAKKAIEELESGKGTAAVRASNAISGLDEASQDPNCPLHARTKIWQAVSVLETITD
jgi:uncharacterized protein (UPF0147 family)